MMVFSEEKSSFCHRSAKVKRKKIKREEKKTYLCRKKYRLYLKDYLTNALITQKVYNKSRESMYK